VKKRKTWPARQDSRITSQFIPDTGDIVIGVARGFTGAGEVLYKLTPEVLAGAIEDRKELAVIVNNLGLLVLAQLSGFNLAESLDDLPRALAKWGHMEKEFDEAQQEKQAQEALAIAQKTVHGKHGHYCGLDAPDFAKGETCECICECTTTSAQTICANNGCELCRAMEPNEGQHSSADGIVDDGNGHLDSDGASEGDNLGGAGASTALATDELGA
jgi:hypothetical protein